LNVIPKVYYSYCSTIKDPKSKHCIDKVQSCLKEEANEIILRQFFEKRRYPFPITPPTNVDPEIILKDKHYWAKHAKKGRSNIHQKAASPFPLPFYETNQNKWGE